MTLYWRGGSDALADNADNWVDANGDPAGRAPETGDTVVLDSGNAAMTWNLDGVAPAAWSQTAGYSGTVTFQTGISRTASGTAYTAHGVLDEDGVTRILRVTGDVTVDGGKWTHSANPSMKSTDAAWADGKGIYRLVAEIGGDYHLGASATVDVISAGFRQNQGPGFGSSEVGASHGGMGMRISADYTGLEKGVGHGCYGSVKKPETLGSGGNLASSVGGGAVRLDVAGRATVAGAVLAGVKADTGSGWGSGAGGSIYIRAGSLEQTGVIAADGGAIGNCSPGGGGRVSMVVTGANADFALATPDNVTAAAGTSRGFARLASPGSVYWEKPADNGRGELVVRGGDYKPTYGHGMQIFETGDATDNDFSRITMLKQASICISRGGVLKTDAVKTDGDTDKKIIFLTGGTINHTGGEFTNAYLNVCACLKDPPTAGAVAYPSSIIIGGGAGVYRAVSTGENVFDAPISLNCDMHIASGATVTHTSKRSFNTLKLTSATGKVDLAVNGSMTIDAGGEVTVKAKGYVAGTGPGRPMATGRIGGSHGGEGAFQTDADYYSLAHSVCYGSIREPVDYGSGSSAYCDGGGAVKLGVSGALTVNGKITAEGGYGASSNEEGAQGAAGGSVWVSAGSLAGSGEIQANGGMTWHYCHSAGGGGRVAVTLTGANSDFDAFRAAGGVITANGGRSKHAAGSSHAGAGTVYLRTGSQGEKDGSLIVANENTPNKVGKTIISPQVLDAEVGCVTVTNGAMLVVDDGRTLTVRGDWFVAAGSAISNGVDSTVVFTGRVGEVSEISGSNEFCNVAFAAPGKTYKFDTASMFAIRPGGVLTVQGAANAEVKLRSSADGVRWPMNFNAGAVAAVDRADVKDSGNIGATVTAYHSVGAAANNVGWNIIGEIVAGDNYWNGSADANWDNSDNWSLGRTPVAGDTVIITNLAAGGYPVLAASFAGDALSVGAGAALTVNGTLSLSSRLAVKGALSGTGLVEFGGSSLDLTGGSVDFGGVFTITGSAELTADFTGDELGALTLSRTGGAVNLPAGAAAGRFTVSGSGSVICGAGSAISCEEVRIDGLIGGAPSIQLASAGGAAWYLRATRFARVNGVTVRDSHADGVPVYATSSVSAGGNENWYFSGTQCTWTGAAGTGSWHDAGNWSGGEVPGADDSVIVGAGAKVRAGSAATVRDMYLEGGETVFDGALGVGGGVDVGDGAVLALNAASTVQNAVMVRSGGVLTHSANTNAALTAGVTNRIDLTVGGDMTVEAGGMIDLYAKGFPAGKGPGAGNVGRSGASHGGRGSDAADASHVKPCYGSIREPVTLGSGASQAGGGAARLTVGGVLQFDGELNAEGLYITGANSYLGNYGGAGGSCWITCGELRGGGTFNLNGARGTGSWHGAGGRFALWQTSAAGTNAFTGSITAYGGMTDTGIGTLTSRPDSSCGTIFFHNAGDAANGGTLVLDNKNGCHNETHYYPSAPSKTDFPAGDDPVGAFAEVSVVLRKGAALNLVADVAVRDIDVQASSTKPKMRLNGYRLKVETLAHRGGKGWGYAYEDCVTDGDTAGGAVVWPALGFMLLLR
ncbi:MAG: hypothetical protein J6T01_04590 [Kiritimatiellae bacterium]|nr:hypothetical protein [Kiritimatiellia bacterium]